MELDSVFKGSFAEGIAAAQQRISARIAEIEPYERLRLS